MRARDFLIEAEDTIKQFDRDIESRGQMNNPKTEPQQNIPVEKPDTQPKLDIQKSRDTDNSKTQSLSQKNADKQYTINAFRNFGAYMGQNLWSMSDYEYNPKRIISYVNEKNYSEARNNGFAAFRNETISDLMYQLAVRRNFIMELDSFFDHSPKNYWVEGDIHALIYNSEKDAIYAYFCGVRKKATGILNFTSYYKDIGQYVDKNLSDENLNEKQTTLLNELIETSRSYVKLANRYINNNYELGQTSALSLRKQVLDILRLGSYHFPPGKMDIENSREILEILDSSNFYNKLPQSLRPKQELPVKKSKNDTTRVE